MKSALVACTAAVSLQVVAQDVATCRAPSGWGYYFPPGASTGWQQDRISDGVFSLVRTRDDYDIVYVDVTKRPVSSKNDGALVRLVGRTSSTLTVLVYYPDTGNLETYGFLKGEDGKHRFTLSQTRLNAMFPKASLMTGECDPIRFEALP
jgi:hypothetical protein